MELRRADTSPERRPDRDVRGMATPRTRPITAKLETDLMEGLVRESQKLYFRHRTKTGNRQTQGRAHDRALGERRVDDALDAEPLLKALSRAEYSTKAADVEAENHDAFIPLH